MKKVKFEFEVILDNERLKPAKTISVLKICNGKKEFIIKYSKKN